jgi:hypothetical protein
MDIPILKINQNELENLMDYLVKHEQLLKEFGGIKIELNPDCKLALKKRKKNLLLNPIMDQIEKINQDQLIYTVKKVDQILESYQENLLIKDELSFWSSLSSSKRQTNISILPNKSFFKEKTSRLYFDLHRLPKKSILKLTGRKLSKQFLPYVLRAHGPGAIFPLTCANQHLFSINYHHEGGEHYWYIIPNSERKYLTNINSSICLDHGQLIIDPQVLDQNHIRYYRTIQHPNEFIVLSAGTLTQSFTKDQSWSEAIDFVLPSWIEQASLTHCQCKQYIPLNLFTIINLPTPPTNGNNSSNQSSPNSLMTSINNEYTQQNNYQIVK